MSTASAPSGVSLGATATAEDSVGWGGGEEGLVGQEWELPTHPRGMGGRSPVCCLRVSAGAVTQLAGAS